ncbi:PAS domain-containing sensor histidine kinase [Haloarchaeobius sp. HME9146]|uniref:PAS domain-containing sensor histidine kinase n=1 Tax=Haloarchaeobius sp. HME9146 TaxID=2978732 RepID=UPI0021BED83B|nr:PAS domain-containing sensor histidine kinase [Haloarchaeobius sp. HME9146]MCT9096376.1 PAS domain-containing sensor histidine kinase [Haloarchaeobius sp. HME9146]
MGDDPTEIRVLALDSDDSRVPSLVEERFEVVRGRPGYVDTTVDCVVATTVAAFDGVSDVYDLQPGTPIVAAVPAAERGDALAAGATLTCATGQDFDIALVQTVERTVRRRWRAAKRQVDEVLGPDSGKTLQTNRAGLLAITEAVPDLIIVYDADGRYVEIKTNQQVLDFDVPEDVIGMSVDEVLPPEAAAEIQDIIDETLGTGEEQEMEYDVTFQDETFWFEARTRPLEGVDEEYVVFVAREVTERKAYETELERQNERLEQFAQVVSHDLRNPLNVARGNLDLVRLTDDLDRLDGIEASLDRMAELVDDLLTLARNGQDVEDPRPVDPETVAKQAWVTVDAPDATLEVETADTPILADDGRLRQLFENLYRNSVEHASTNSRAEPDPTGDGVTVRVETTESGFRVIDDGPGIPPDDREQVFEHGYTTAESGTGFGLAIVEDIAEAHGWQIAVVDPPESMGGACFEISGVTFA